MKMGCVFLLLITARYFTTQIELKNLLVYGVFFALIVLFVIDIHQIAYSVLCVAGGVGFALVIGLKETVLFIPLLLFLLLSIFEKKANQKTKEPIKKMRTLFVAFLFPAALILVAVFTTKNNETFGWFLSDRKNAIHACCLALFTIGLLYFLRVRLLSGSRHKNTGEAEASSYTFLLLSYVEALIFAVIILQSFIPIIIMSDIWLALTYFKYTGQASVVAWKQAKSVS